MLQSLSSLVLFGRTLPAPHQIPSIYSQVEPATQTEALSTQTTQPLYVYITPFPGPPARLSGSRAVPSRFALPPHPHNGVIDAINASGDHKPDRDRQPPLKDYCNWFKVYWDITAHPLATYLLGRNTLVVCEEGVWEINEDIDYCRFRGKEDHLEDGPWIYYDHYLSRNEDEEDEEEDIFFG
ncbi:hypothetical protein BJ508DRAFT_329501 [Ascobolus immersus RN42]|uniref:Uncharacterized protein n=1 Tax=Ascobolus immersus RN42 TaxID=1160509 RepID=A0A3N4HWD0_ASCIM|nr:hypothetical protein BJ508DRAFT_329501 [Ascobolus immersus RN42]